MKDRTGEKYTTAQGYGSTIIKYVDCFNSTVQFDDERGTTVYNIVYSHIKSKNLRNPNHRSVCGVGYEGIGKYKFKEDGKHTKVSIKWHNLIKRGYSISYHLSRPTYKDVTVCTEWHNFQNFAAWFEANSQEDYHLDKDILIKGNKVYSPETCCFVPNDINILFSDKIKKGEYPRGVHKLPSGRFQARFGKDRKSLGTFDTSEEAFYIYKITKEGRIKELANKHRGQITEQCYQAMITYKVEIID